MPFLQQFPDHTFTQELADAEQRNVHEIAHNHVNVQVEAPHRMDWILCRDQLLNALLIRARARCPPSGVANVPSTERPRLFGSFAEPID